MAAGLVIMSATGTDCVSQRVCMSRVELVASAGVAAAFRSPVGGVLFALEEMTSWFCNELLWYAFFTTAVVSVAGEDFKAFKEGCRSWATAIRQPSIAVVHGIAACHWKPSLAPMDTGGMGVGCCACKLCKPHEPCWLLQGLPPYLA